MSLPLPSLDLLQVFEACGRCLSFTAAGAELGMTQPAVSQHVQRLEQALGVRLFHRVHRGIAPTAAGAALLGPVQEALALVQGAVASATAQPVRELLSVATDFAFAAFWLMPRLERFYQRHPQIDVSLVTSNRALTHLPADVDLAVAFGDGRVQRGVSRLLLPEQVFPVCSPRLLQDHGGDAGAALRRGARLHLKPAPGQQWHDWRTADTAWSTGGEAAPSPPAFDNYTLVVGAALAGQGVALGWRHLVEPLMAQGLLCRLREDSLDSRLGYHLVLPQRKRQPAMADAFAQWLASELPPHGGPPLDSDHG